MLVRVAAAKQGAKEAKEAARNDADKSVEVRA